MPPDSRPTAAQRLIGDAVPKPVSLPDVVLFRPALRAGPPQAVGAAKEVRKI
ncbi:MULTISPECIES: hypothetical protein [unclassified Streptomyces]|uniref:hypothetical protein n=1 Tax=unclassified Streptomyces TaxID=2593676 RepID=UPI00336A6A8C